MSYEIGVDVGGTFTDLFCLDEDGTVRVTKVSTTANQALGIVEGIDQFGVSGEDISFLAHGTTTATNALITKRGARTALITTRGFRDVLEFRRTNKDELYDLQWTPPPTIIPRHNRLEITERTTWDGETLIPLAEEEVPGLVRILTKREIEAVAIVLLHGFRNPDHEVRLAELLRAELPDLYICVSSEILPEYREFERTATVSANAFVAPVMQRYFGRLREELDGRGFGHDVLIMQSNGGLSSLDVAAETPAKLVRSGPSAGAVGMVQLARETGQPNLIGLDIGGTSADVGLVVDGRPKLSNHLDVEFGLPIMFPSLDIISIGAGGGSIARVDIAGGLSVGPDSAGSIPGPACYGKGGVEPTSTDAQLALGRLSADGLVGGAMTIDPELSRAAIQTHVADRLGMDMVEAAAGIVRILTDNMMRAVRFVTIEKGYDPRDFALCGFGGSGPMYAVDIARELSIPRVVVPASPGVFSAYGLLRSDVVYDASRTLLFDLEDIDAAMADEVFVALEERVLARFAADGVGREEVVFRRELDMRYTAQAHALTIPLVEETIDERARGDIAARFHDEHRRAYGHAEPRDPMTVVSARVFGQRPRPIRSVAPAGVDASAVAGERDVYFDDGGWQTTPVIPRSSLAPGERVEGPALVTQIDATTILPPGCVAVPIETGAMIVEVAA